MRYQARLHPYLDILCDSLGRVLVPANRARKAHWTFGNKNCRTGYCHVQINNKVYPVARLICETFHGPAPEDRPTCDHRNRIRDDNRAFENLHWADRKTQQNNRQVCYDSLAKYGIRSCEDPVAYNRARRTKDPRYAESVRASNRKYYAKNAEKCRASSHERYVKNAEQRRANRREYYAKNAEQQRANAREYRAQQKARGKHDRKCPDGSRQWLTDAEFFEKFGFWPKK